MQEAKLVALIEPILAEQGLELDSLDVTPIGKRRILKVTVDGEGPQGRGPLVDDIASAANAISAALDESPAVGAAPFTLEVSSRGVSKPLTDIKHYRRNLGRLVKVNVGETQLLGRILGVAESEVTLEVDGAPQVVAVAEVTKAVVQIEMNRPQNQDELATDEFADEQDEED